MYSTQRRQVRLGGPQYFRVAERSKGPRFRDECRLGGLVERRRCLGPGGHGRADLEKNFSCPEGEHMQSSRAGWPEALVKACGALAGTLTVWPARATMCSPRKVSSTSPSSTVNISSKSWRCGGGPPPGGTCMSMRVYRPAVSSPVSRIVYVSPTTPRCGSVWSPSGRATARCRRGSSGGTGGCCAVAGLLFIALLLRGSRGGPYRRLT